MHFGVIIARAEWPTLHAALQVRCGALRDAGEVSPSDWFDPPSGEDMFHVASSDGTTYILDPTMVLSADSDLITGVARDLSCLVVGAGGETVSGTFWLTAAEGPDLRRVYFNVVATMTAPFTLGDTLPSEATTDWDDIDGAGIFARLHDLGLATEILDRGPDGPGRRLVWEGDQLPEQGPLGTQINDHCTRHQRPDADDWLKNIAVQTRPGGGYDLTGSTSPKPNKESRWKGLFKRNR